MKQGVARSAVFDATPRLPATHRRLRFMALQLVPSGAMKGRQTMTVPETPRRAAGTGLMGGWISRVDLALELGVTVETLRRWEGMRFGPPCVRAGRKVYYRRDGVHDWLQQQERPTARRAGGRR